MFKQNIITICVAKDGKTFTWTGHAWHQTSL